MGQASSEQRRTQTVDDSKERKGVAGRGHGSGGHEAGSSSSSGGGGGGGGGVGSDGDGEGPEADRGAADAYAQYGTVVRVLRADLPEVGARCDCKVNVGARAAVGGCVRPGCLG